MASEDKFKANVIATLSKRAANRCSNPDCYCITSGPADTPTASVLFEWQRGHEHRIALQVGKVGAEIRDRYEQRH